MARPIGRQRSWQGLTLIELLVVLVIMAIAATALSLSLPDADRRTLQRQAEQLSAELEAARPGPRSSGLPVVWTVREGGYAFEGRSPAAPVKRWLDADLEVDWGAGRRTGSLVLGPEPILPAQSLKLRLRAQQLQIASDGLLPFAAADAP